MRLAPGREFLFHVLATLGLFFSISFIPLAGFLAGVLTPLPTVLIVLRYGVPAGLLAPFVAEAVGVIVLLWLGMVSSIPYLTAMLGMGVILGYGTRHAWSSEKTIGLPSLAVVVMAGLLLVLAYVETKGALVSLLEQDLREAISAAFKAIGTTPSAETHEVESSLLAAVPAVIRIMPGITVSCIIGIAWLNELFARRYCRAAGLHECIAQDWTLWKAPEPLVWAVIASGAALMVPIPGWKLVAMNVMIVLGGIYFLHGLSITAFYLNKWKLPLFLRALIYGFLALQQFASMALAIMGLFDMWMDFRRLTRKAA